MIIVKGIIFAQLYSYSIRIELHCRREQIPTLALITGANILTLPMVRGKMEREQNQ